jgi:hypothetical protein
VMLVLGAMLATRLRRRSGRQRRSSWSSGQATRDKEEAPYEV